MLTHIAILALGALATAVYFLLTKRRRVLKLDLDIDGLPSVTDGLGSLAGLTKGAVYEGNRVTVYQNGALLEAMQTGIKEAKSTVHLEAFVWATGQVESQWVALLCERARSGLDVRLLLDAVGARTGSDEAFKNLKDAGVNLRFYCRPRWWNLRRFNHRTHRKLLIIDGHLAFTGGHGISDLWTGDAEDAAHYRDTGIAIEGPAAIALQSVFMENWIEETHSVPSGHACFSQTSAPGTTSAHIVSSATGDAISSVALLYTLAIASARDEIIIQNPYFSPERDVAKLLGEMVKRGVKVHLMVPGGRTDSPIVRRAGMALYRGMLEAGVRIYEFCPTLLHQKIVIVDGAWSHVGSTNFDARALALNEEVGVGLLDRTIANQLREAFLQDLARSEKIHLENWRERAWFDRLVDDAVYLLRAQI